MKLYTDEQAWQIASTLRPWTKAYLLGDSDNEGTRHTLTHAGYLDDEGRLTPFGVRIARIVAAEAAWTAEDSADLDAEIRASRKPRKQPRKNADSELAAACRAITKYKLKKDPRRERGNAIPGFGLGRNEPTRAFS